MVDEVTRRPVTHLVEGQLQAGQRWLEPRREVLVVAADNGQFARDPYTKLLGRHVDAQSHPVVPAHDGSGPVLDLEQLQHALVPAAGPPVALNDQFGPYRQTGTVQGLLVTLETLLTSEGL